MNILSVSIDDLRTEGLQTRAETNGETVTEYAELMQEGKDFKPVTVFRDENNNLYLADGFHRVAAARSIGREVISADIREGGFVEALRFALTANAMNGLHRSNADKQRAMEIAWANRKLLFSADDMNDDKGIPLCRHFAAICGVSRGLANSFLTDYDLSKLDKPSIVTKVEEKKLEDKTPEELDAVIVTSEHLEERDPVVRGNLKRGHDRFGMKIPEALLPVFGSTLPKELCRQARGIKSAIEKSHKNKELMFRPIYQQVVAGLNSLIRCLYMGQPYCVCRGCHGHGCYRCGKLGFQTRQQYDNLTDDLKVIEEKGV